jgi:hypothetical protein
MSYIRGIIELITVLKQWLLPAQVAQKPKLLKPADVSDLP